MNACMHTCMHTCIHTYTRLSPIRDSPIAAAQPCRPGKPVPVRLLIHCVCMCVRTCACVRVFTCARACVRACVRARVPVCVWGGCACVCARLPARSWVRVCMCVGRQLLQRKVRMRLYVCGYSYAHTYVHITNIQRRIFAAQVTGDFNFFCSGSDWIFFFAAGVSGGFAVLCALVGEIVFLIRCVYAFNTLCV